MASLSVPSGSNAPAPARAKLTHYPNVVRDRLGRLVPTGDCWCGCEAAANPGNFWAPGHDKRAESAVINIKYGSVAEFLIEHGFGPAGRNAHAELEEWRKGGGKTR